MSNAFDSNNYPTQVPFELKLGDFWAWKDTKLSTDYANSAYTLTYEFNLVDGDVHALLSGNVSTENNGGFIQIRRELKNIDLSKAKSIRLYAKGNNEKYYIFLRTTGTMLPWQYYSYEFTVNEEYNEFIMPIKDFNKSGTLLAKQINPKKITSVAIVAYGRDHVAEIYVKELEFIE